MDVRVRERLVGALVLVAVVVLLVPAVLKGPERTRAEPPREPTRSVVVPLRDTLAPAEEDELLPEPEAAASANPSAAAPAEPPKKPMPDPGRAATESPADRPAATAGAAATGTPAWAVQLGAFSTRDKADGLVTDLRRRGYAAFVLEYRADGKVLHRVRVGPEQDRARAAAIAERLRKDGFQPVVAPHP